MSNRWMVAISVLLTLLVGYLAYTLFEYYEEDKDLGWRKVALKNPYLAAELYLQRLGNKVQSFDGFDELTKAEQSPLTGIDTLFISNSSQILSEKRLRSIINWVEGGGQLVVAAQKPSELNHDRILSYFGITAIRTDFKKPLWGESDGGEASKSSPNNVDEDRHHSDKKRKNRDQLERINEELIKKGIIKSKSNKKPLSAEEKIREFEKGVAKTELTNLSFSGNDSIVNVHFDSSVALEHPDFFSEDHSESENQTEFSALKPLYWEGDKYGVHFIQIYLGEGLVSVVSDASIFQSGQIDKFDHAYLWDLLVNNQGSSAILYGTNMPGLGRMLKMYLPEALLAFSLWGLAWVWYNGRRFGTLLNNDVRVRRSMSEHIFATASYMWHGGWKVEMLNPIRDEIKRRAAQTLPAFSRVNSSEQWRKLGEESGIDEAMVAKAMTVSSKLSEENFIQTVQVLQKIRKSL